MKNNFLKFSLIAFLSVVWVGCDNNESADQIVESFDQEEAALTAKLDNSTEVLSDTFLQVYEFEESANKSAIHPFLPECVTITVEITDTSKTVTVDFGSEGCEVRGHLIKGKIIMSYDADPDAMVLVINYTLEDLFVDDVQFSGSKTVTRQKANENGNPQYSMNLDFTVTFSDGTQASRIGTKTREWIEGAFNGNWGDNVFLITGAWETNFVNGNTHSTTITEALRREASCRFLVSGELDLVRTNFSGSLNYGDGSCDNLAIFTNEDGEETEIRL
ncbi:hypothetical protein [Aquimarina sp. 2201CG5-10]|uniref:hypothetical protein n=1 Tax=Aquimarina callyspongiae TaxID=3098150 RepID=UPI002AB5D9C4|nr:hypothetical protein [Aquimarina sp. 2201CG5-10]MDY8138822.1 hypothetical protein [Aquimarina sp. 2201CG5-10]